MSQSPSTQANGTPVPNKASEVGWLFVPQYYTFMNKDPSRLHCFYTKKSTMVHGTENEDVTPSVGQQAIHERVNAIGFEDTKVYVSNVDSQSSADGGIVIQVLGEMSNKGGKWRKFAQTFFLAQQPNGFYVLNDIFRYLKDDDDEKDEAREDEPQADEAAPVSVADTPAAREATEAAIRNPLLEDVNLQGARGILVNITAGPDLSLGEYSDVGNIIEQFASEQATVKVGTVIDADMRDELHVTVVATGLGARMEKPVKVVDNTVQVAVSQPVAQQPAAQPRSEQSVNYKDYERPTVQRQSHSGAATAAKLNTQDDLDYLDIPAFLRRQAD